VESMYLIWTPPLILTLRHSLLKVIELEWDL
jgi:hypothetical protein